MSHLTDETSTPETAEQEVSGETPDTEAVTPEAPETGAEAAAAAEPEAETAAGESEGASAEEPEVEAVVEAEPEVEAAADAEPEAEAVAEAEPEVEAVADAEPEVEAVAEPEPEAEAAPAEQAAEPASEAGEAAAGAAKEPEPAVEAAEEVTADAAATEATEAAEPEQAAASEPETSAEAAEPSAEASEPAAAAAEEPAAAPSEPEAADAPETEAATETKSAEAEEESEEKPVVLDGAMAELAKAMEEKTPVKGQVIGWNKGGYHVAVGKIAAFCPVSQIEIGNPRGPKRYLDKTFSFHVIEIQNSGRRVVLSRAAAIKAEREQRAALVKELLQPGAELEGKVSSLTDFGAFVDLGGGIEGLVHVSEISRRRVEHPKEALRKGQKVKVRVLKIEKGGQRISLSMKRLEPDPWKGVADRFPAGSQFTGKVLRKADFGLFIEVEPGLEGLVHTSRRGLGQSLESESLQVGEEVSGWVHEVEAKRKRLSLSLREVAGGNPWQGVNDRFPVGDIVKGTVERLTNFGVFIELEPGLTGLLPFSVLGGGAGNPRRQYHAGKEVSVRVLAIDRDKRRISLGTESSKAEGSQQDYREYLKKSKSRGSSGGSGLNAMAAAFAKLKERQSQGAQK